MSKLPAALTLAPDRPKPCHECNGTGQAPDQDVENVRYPGLGSKSLPQEILDVLMKIDARIMKLGARVEEVVERLPPAPGELEEDEVLDIKYILHGRDDDDKVNKLGTHGILTKLHQQGGCWKSILTVRHIPPRQVQSAGPEGQERRSRPSCLLLTVKTHEAEDEIRRKETTIGKVIELSPNCYALPRRYVAHVENFDANFPMGEFQDWTHFFRHYTGFPDIRVKVAFTRFLIETSSRRTAVWLCRNPLKIGETMFKVIPFAPQGIPMFCYACNRPGHFQEVCGFGGFRCGFCSGDHPTTKCQIRDRLRCCNCQDEHAAWDHRCKDRRSQQEHSKASLHRKRGPFWKHLVYEDKSTAAKRRADPEQTPDSPGERSRKRTKEDATSTATPTGIAPASGTTAAPSTQPTPAPKKKRGRPPKPKPGSDEPSQFPSTPSPDTVQGQTTINKPLGKLRKPKISSDDPRQTSILQYHCKKPPSAFAASKPAVGESAPSAPDTLLDTEMAGMEAWAVQDNAWSQHQQPPENAIVTTKSRIEPDMPTSTMMDTGPTGSQENGADQDQMPEPKPDASKPGKKKKKNKKNQTKSIVTIAESKTQDGEEGHDATRQRMAVAQDKEPEMPKEQPSGSEPKKKNKKKKKKKTKDKKRAQKGDGVAQAGTTSHRNAAAQDVLPKEQPGNSPDSSKKKDKMAQDSRRETRQGQASCPLASVSGRVSGLPKGKGKIQDTDGGREQGGDMDMDMSMVLDSDSEWESSDDMDEGASDYYN
ncbi:hypothetical protein ACJ41O_010435 [Fusarium nematophilum]